jgi:hypothetical protein
MGQSCATEALVITRWENGGIVRRLNCRKAMCLVPCRPPDPILPTGPPRPSNCRPLAMRARIFGNDAAAGGGRGILGQRVPSGAMGPFRGFSSDRFQVPRLQAAAAAQLTAAVSLAKERSGYLGFAAARVAPASPRGLNSVF